MDLSYSLDILFMIMAFLAVRRTLPSIEQINAPESEPSTPAGMFKFNPPNFGAPRAPTPVPAPAPSPSPRSAAHTPPTSAFKSHSRRDSLAVPQITLTPELVSRTRPKHGRKSVSFSLSSMDELVAKRGSQKRPPTPYVQGPADPASEDLPLLPIGVERLSASPEVRDAMGVKKEWLMPK